MHELDEPALIAFVFEHYHQALLSSARAHRFLRALNLDDPQTINVLKLGFVDRTLGFQLPDGTTNEGRLVRGTLVRLGVLRASGHETFWGCVVFPLFHDNGHIIGGYGFRLKAHEHAHRLATVSWVSGLSR